MKDLNFKSIWPVESVDVQPEVVMINWSIRSVVYETSGQATHHLVGYSENTHEGRVSSFIIDFDQSKKIVTTRSGRKYLLKGQPGFDGDAEHVWQNWKHMNQAHSECDVTNDYVEKLHP